MLKIINRIQGWRTHIAAGCVILYGFVEMIWPEFRADLPEAIRHGGDVMLTGAGMMYLRYVTSTPSGQRATMTLQTPSATVVESVPVPKPQGA